ncbi:MAG: thiaminase II [Candidatus Limnocylindria bacterium]
MVGLRHLPRRAGPRGPRAGRVRAAGEGARTLTPSSRLRRAAARPWRTNLEHPFVRGIGDGTLQKRRFLHYLGQDHLFLVDYARVLALAAARAPRVTDMASFAELLHSTLGVEMALHRRLCAREGIASLSLERTPAGPTTRAYGDFLVRAAYERDLAGLLAALLPCMWGYAEIAAALRARGLPRVARYREWIETYAGEEFTALAGLMRSMYDRVGSASAAERELFLTGTRYELAFWEASWQATPHPGGRGPPRTPRGVLQ